MYNEEKIFAWYRETLQTDKEAKIATMSYKDGFDAALEIIGRILDVTGEVGYTATTKSGNKLRIRLDSP